MTASGIRVAALSACLTAAAATLTLSGCTWVRLNDAGAEVQLLQREDVSACRRVGTVSANTRDRIVLRRGAAKVQEELIVLASNEAASIGGDVIVAQGPPDRGAQGYIVYRCRE